VGAVWLRARAQLRGRLVASLLLALLVGLAGGVVMAAVAGARRSDAALPRFLAASRTTDATIWFTGPRGGQPSRTDVARELDAVAALPRVRSAQRVVSLIMSGSDPLGPTLPSRQLGWVGLDAVGAEVFGRPMVVAGRLPRPDRADEAAVDEEFAWRQNLRVGAAFRVGTYTRAQFGPAGEGAPIQPKGPAVDLRVTGIVRFPDDLVAVAEGRDEVDGDESSQLYLNPAFWRRYGPDLANYGIAIAVDLHQDHADLPVFTKAVQRHFAGEVFINSAEFTQEENTPAFGVRRAIALETAALLVFAALTALAMFLLVGQTLAREVFLESTEHPTLRALGMTQGQLVAIALFRAVVIGMGGAAVAVAAAAALSTLTPIGVARRAELNPGMLVDWPVLGCGSLVIVVLVTAWAAMPAWRAARAPGDVQGVIAPAGRGRPSPMVAMLTATAVPPTAVIGARLALEPGRGRTAVPVRVALVGGAVAVCAVIAVAGFGASLAHLTGTPREYGATWDVGVGNFASATAAQPVADRLYSRPEVAATAGLLSYLNASIDGQYLPLMAFEERKGSLTPAIVDGREPLRLDEIVLGSITLRSLGKRIGDTVTLVVDRQPPRSLRIVGRAVLNLSGFDTLITPGKGGIVHPSVFRRLSPGAQTVYPSTFLVRLDPAADRDRTIAQLRRDFAGRMIAPQPHADIRNLQRVGGLPGLLASLVVLLALGTMTHTLGTSIRRRRRDLAVLKTLGFTRGQVGATIAWQATTFAVVALCVGLPLGVAAGRWAWQFTADALGVSSAPVVPPAAVLAGATGAVIAANLVAAVPGRAASRLRPATALRSE
jgi:hypothetical protein